MESKTSQEGPLRGPFQAPHLTRKRPRCGAWKIEASLLIVYVKRACMLKRSLAAEPQMIIGKWG
jgi:hypothetical protein